MRSAFAVRSVSHRAMRALNYTPEVEAFRAMSGLRHVRLAQSCRAWDWHTGPYLRGSIASAQRELRSSLRRHVRGRTRGGALFVWIPCRNRNVTVSGAWQVLIAGAGTLGENELYGRPIIADGRLVDRFVGPDAMVLTFEDEGGSLNLYTYAFLCSAIGLKAIRSTVSGQRFFESGEMSSRDSQFLLPTKRLLNVLRF